MVASQAEPEWDDEQRGLMLALAEVEGSECPSCHGDLAETTDVAYEGKWTPTSQPCYRCLAINMHAQKRAQEKHSDSLLFGAYRRT